MKPLITSLIIFLLLYSNAVYAQQTIDEAKVQKGLAIMKKMTTNPGEIMTLQTEMQALKLNSAENKEVRTRMTAQASEIAKKGTEQAMNMGGITQADINKRMEEQQRIVPVRNETRINSVLKRTLKDGEIKKFCKLVHDEASKNMDSQKKEHAEKLYAKLKEKSSSPATLGNGAVGCFINGYTQQSLYILGRICSEENFDANNINNYAALLTNQGIEEGAIPLLNYLNKKYGKNPFILSNLSLAWLGLGDLKTAEKYADSCVRFFPDRSQQAHYVKCVVEESKGNHTGAISELQQSIGKAYSTEKEGQLRKWGSKMSTSNYAKKLPPEALGLSKFNLPEFPKNFQAHVDISNDWQAIKKLLEDEMGKLSIQINRLQAEINQNNQKKAEALLKKMQSGRLRSADMNSGKNQGWLNFFTTLSTENALKEDDKKKKLVKIKQEDTLLKQKMDAEIKKLGKLYENMCGEGQGCPQEEICKAYKKVYDEYMEKANKMFEEYYTGYISMKRRNINDEVYAAKYCLDDVEFEKYKKERQKEYLLTLWIINYQTPPYSLLFHGYGSKCINVKQQPSKLKELPRFEDIYCPEEWKAYFGPWTSVSTKCVTITINQTIAIDTKYGKIGFDISLSEDLLTGKFPNVTIEIGVEIGSTEIKNIGIGAEAGAYVEIDGTGITDVGVKGSLGAKNELDGELTFEGRVSVMSGKPSFDTKAELSSTTSKVAKQILSTFNVN